MKLISVIQETRLKQHLLLGGEIFKGVKNYPIHCVLERTAHNLKQQIEVSVGQLVWSQIEETINAE